MGRHLHFENSIPILRVEDLEASLRHYTEVLGFRVDWQVQGDTASVSRDQAAIMLCQRHQGNPGTWVWIGVSDARALHGELTARGAVIHSPLTNHPWALEFQIQDPDGHVLRFGSDPLDSANRET